MPMSTSAKDVLEGEGIGLKVAGFKVDHIYNATNLGTCFQLRSTYYNNVLVESKRHTVGQNWILGL